jgi:hypothetical protein
MVGALKLVSGPLVILCPLLYTPTIFFELIWEHLRQSRLDRFTCENHVRARGGKWGYVSSARPEPGALPS